MTQADLRAGLPEETNPEEEYMLQDLIFNTKSFLLFFNILEEKCQKHSCQPRCRRRLTVVPIIAVSVKVSEETHMALRSHRQTEFTDDKSKVSR